MIEQAIYGTEGPDGYHFLTRSAGFREEWLPEAVYLCTGFGERPAGIACPACVFALPFADRHVAVVQVADQGNDDVGRPGALAFRLLILPHRLYSALGGDPFRIAEQFPPPWEEKGQKTEDRGQVALSSVSLSSLEWPGPVGPAQRSVEQVRKILDVPDRATLLGGVQALVDGGRLVFERTEPDPQLLRSLWALLPTATRSELWPASFAFCNRHGFHVVIVPRAAGPDYENAVFESQAGDYPEGRYETELHIAAQTSDQQELDRLFSRRSRSQTLRLALVLLALFILGPIVGMLVSAMMPPAKPPQPTGKSAPEFELPPTMTFPPLEAGERKRLAEKLGEIATRHEVPAPHGTSSGALMLTLEALDARLGTPDANRDPGRRGRIRLAINTMTLPPAVGPLGTALTVTFGPTGQLRDQGPLQRGLRTLLWKHAVPEYNEPLLNTVELAERLANKLAPADNKP